ncbi:hypothetical protein EVJ58_g10428, partial [Rhodofomes roseus]
SASAAVSATAPSATSASGPSISDSSSASAPSDSTCVPAPIGTPSAIPRADGTAVQDSHDDEDNYDDEFGCLDSPEEGDENSQVDVTTCVERWRNAGPESRKKMFALFAVTGVFVCVCRHGHLLAICDMIRSGELMKYPLAIIDRLMNVYGSDILVGYDIACAFARTVANSSLAQRAKDMRLTGIVPAFHGHGHNRGCQVHWHPRYFIGAGKEDFEGCERLFSASNHLASGTRLASAFHRHQAIVEFFSHWDDSKHAESGNFIYNNYRQALAIRKESAEALEVLCSKLHVTTLDLEHFLDEEREYLRSRKKEPPEVSRKADYMAALKRLEAAGLRKIHTEQEAAKEDFYIVYHGYQRKEIAALRRNRTIAARQYQLVDDECQAFEDELELEHRWVTGSPEYAQAEEDLAMRNYHLAVDNLERLIVQRLFELTKLGMSGVGYKLREKISKGLKARAEAIKKALTRYNKHAAALVPPRPSLSWDEVLEMVSLAEFDLLRDARTDIRKEPWADRKNREAMNILFDMKRAEEEIERLNVEIPRLLTFMHDDHIDFYNAIARNIITHPPLAHELAQRWTYRDRIHANIAARLQQTARLPGFSGSVRTGQRLGRAAQGGNDVPLPDWAMYAPLADNGVSAEGTEGDDMLTVGSLSAQDSDTLVTFMDNLGVHDRTEHET